MIDDKLYSVVSGMGMDVCMIGYECIQVKVDISRPTWAHQPLLASGTKAGQFLSDFLHFSSHSVVASLKETALLGEAGNGLQERGGTVLESFVAVDHCHFDKFLNVLRLGALVLSLKFCEFLICWI